MSIARKKLDPQERGILNSYLKEITKKSNMKYWRKMHLVKTTPISVNYWQITCYSI